MPWGTVIGLDHYGYTDAEGVVRRAKRGQVVEVPDEREFERALAQGWLQVAPAGTRQRRSARNPVVRAKRPDKPTLFFVTPAFERYEISALCFEQRRRLIDELGTRGLIAACVVIADDDNLALARGFDFDTIEQDNRSLGRRFNAGIEHACREGARFVCCVGSDTWLHADFFAAFPRGREIRCSRNYAVVPKHGRFLACLRLGWEGGIGSRIIPADLLEPCGNRPASEQIKRGIDTSILRGLREHGPVKPTYADIDPLQAVGFESEIQLNPYDGRDPRLRSYLAEECWNVYERLAARYPEELVERAERLYGKRWRSEKRKPKAAPRSAEKAVLVGLASIPERVASLERVVASLAPQADRVAVSLNGYESVPGFLERYPNVEATLRGDAGGDAEKFAAVDDWEGFVVTADDDVLYPPDYVGRLLAGIGRHGRGTVVGFHGGKTLGWNGSAKAASHKTIRCLGSLAKDDVDVNVLGTGAMAYHAAHVPLWRDVFRHANMADVQLACHARAFGIPLAVLAHEKGWLKDICPPGGRRIYESNAQRDGSACDTTALREQELVRFDWSAAPAPRPRVRISLATCERAHLLPGLLSDLEREAAWLDVSVAVYEDPGAADYTEARKQAARNGWDWIRFERRLGKLGHWRLVAREFADCRAADADWFVFLPDDVRLARHALPRALEIWQRLEDPATLTLWRLKDQEGQTNWTGQLPVEREHAWEVFHVDGIYLCKRETLDLLRYECTAPPRRRHISSGVGRGLSLRLHGAGRRMYRVGTSLAIPVLGEPSVMNPDATDRVQPGVVV